MSAQGGCIEMTKHRDGRVVTYNSPRHYRNPDVLAPTNFAERAVVPIYHIDDPTEPAFDLVFFGLGPNDFYYVPGGAAPIFEALRRRGLDPTRYTTNMFAIRSGDNVYQRA